jgi:transposase
MQFKNLALSRFVWVALGISSPWFIETVHLDEQTNSLEIKINFTSGAKFACPNCNTECSVHDTMERRWHHLNFLHYCCYITARVPRINCSKCGKIIQIEAPFARSGSGFSLLLECMMLQLAKIMPVNEVANLLMK